MPRIRRTPRVSLRARFRLWSAFKWASLKSRIWLAIFWVDFILIIKIYSWAFTCSSKQTPLCALINNGVSANLLAGLLVSTLFFCLAMDFGRESNSILRSMKELDENERQIERFERFLRTESYHDATFPELSKDEHSLGLTYTIEPRRTREGEPVSFDTEMGSYRVVRVREIAHLEVMNEEDRKEYEGSPIQTGRHYFCRFFNSDWHMSSGTCEPWYKFFLSGKVGPVEYGISADDFVSTLPRIN